MHSARITLSPNVDDQSRSVILPWLRQQSLLAWQYTTPTVILVPTRIETFYWKQQLASAGHPLLGIYFWTPSDARKFLLQKIAQPAIVSRNDLELLTRLSAEWLLSQDYPENVKRFLQAMQREPGSFIAQYEMLVGAGWSHEVGSDGENVLAQALRTQLAHLQLQTQAEAHRALRLALENDPSPFLRQLLVVGFNASHWPIWDLLAAASLASAECTIALTAPRTFAAEPDRLWISSWENWLGISYEEPFVLDDVGPVSTPFFALADSFEKGDLQCQPIPNLQLVVGADVATHARAIVTQTLLWLRQPSCTRLGLIFPDAGPLSLAVAEQLRDLQVPHNDGTGFLRPGPFGQPSWSAWMDLQESPNAARFLAWYLACENEVRRELSSQPPPPEPEPDALDFDLNLGQPFEPGAIRPEAEPTALEVERALNEVIHRVLVDELAVLQQELQKSSHPRRQRLAEILRDRIQLPEQALFSEFVRLTKNALDQSDALTNCLPPWLPLVPADSPPITRATYLTWLRAATDIRARQRDEQGNEFYGKVHLLIAAQMTGQTWSHLLLAEMNRGVWPREPGRTSLLSRQALAALNRQARRRNLARLQEEAKSFETGGAEPAQPLGHGYCLAPSDRPELNLRDLCAALENTGTALCLTSALKQGDRLLAPNELFSHCYQIQNQKPLDDDSFRKAANETALLWGSRRKAVWESPATEAASWGAEPFATAFAFRTRRNPAELSGPFQFAYAFPPENRIQMSCREWEFALLCPPFAWLTQVVGGQPSPSLNTSWQRTAGTWLHDWLSHALKGNDRNASSLEKLLAKVDNRAENLKDHVGELVNQNGTIPPPWWPQIHQQTRGQTEQVLKSLLPELDKWEVESEMVLPEWIRVSFRPDETASFSLNGRVDCLLLSPQTDTPVEPSPQLPLEGRSAWVIDFKTNAEAYLTIPRLKKGNGWQVILYGWALRQMGAGQVQASLVTPGKTAKAQLELDEALEPGLLHSIELMHKEGIFGQPPPEEYGFAPALPIATLPIPNAILLCKLHKPPSEDDQEVD